jgi:hypothetical protein
VDLTMQKFVFAQATRKYDYNPSCATCVSQDLHRYKDLTFLARNGAQEHRAKPRNVTIRSRKGEMGGQNKGKALIELQNAEDLTKS